MPAPFPDFSFEQASLRSGATFVVGVDEVGRGPLAGPVTAAAVRLNPAHLPTGLRDSKAMTAAARERLFDWLMEHAEVSVAHAGVEEIDALNILRASHLAMERAIAALSADTAPPSLHALVDGNLIPKGLTCTSGALSKGDALCRAIACMRAMWFLIRCFISCSRSARYSDSRAAAAATARACIASFWRAATA